MNDNPYSVTLLPDEFHELLSKNENYVKWWHKDMPHQQLELSGRVLDKLHKADDTHICLDEFQAGERTHAPLGKTVSGRKYLTDEAFEQICGIVKNSMLCEIWQPWIRDRSHKLSKRNM